MKRRTALAALLFAAGLPVALLAQPTPTTPTPAAAPGPGAKPAETVPAARRAAWAVERVTLLDLRLAEFPDESDYAVAEALLAVASRLDPTEPALVRKRIEASWNAGRPEAAAELTKQLIRLDPSDTVAQLRLITDTIGRRQTAAERVALYKKFTATASLDASIRSRLATDAALLSRENDDPSGFREFLRSATTLDSTNKEAAILALETFTQDHPGDAGGRFELMSNLLMADPLDPMVHFSIAAELAGHACFKQADRFHSNGRALLRKTGGRISDEQEVEALVLEWQVDGPAQVLGRITRNLAKQRGDVQRYNEEAAKGVGLANDIGKAEDVRLSVDTEKVRLATAIASENTEAAKASITDLARSCDFKMTVATDDAKRPIGMSREAAMIAAQSAQLDLQYWRVLCGLDTDKVEAALKAYEGIVEEGQVGPEIVRAILASRQGDHAGALRRLDELRAKVPDGQLIAYTMDYARALALEGLSRRDEALEAYRAVARGIPMRPIGAIARFRAEKLTGAADPFTAFHAAVAKTADGIPKYVDEMIDQPKSFMSLLADAPARGAFGDDAPVTITLRNISPIPLAVGSDRTINSRIMLAPTLTGTAARFSPLTRPEIVELDQRLRLAPRDKLEATVHPDLGYPGFVLDLGCDAQARYSWKIIQGFTPSRTGNFIAGPLSLAAESSPVMKSPLAESKVPAAELAEKISRDGGDALYRDLLATRQRLWAELLIEDMKPPVVEKDAKAAGGKAGDPKAPAGKADPKAPAGKPADAKTPDPKSPDPKAPAGKPADPKAGAKPDPKDPVTKTPAPKDPAPKDPAPKAGDPKATDPKGAGDADAPAPPEKPVFDFAGERRTLAAALTARYATLDATHRLLVACMFPHAGQVAELAGLDAAILADTDPDVRKVALMSRVSSPEAPEFAAALAGDDPVLKDFAARLKGRLAAPGPRYCRLTGGLRKLRGETESPTE